MKIMKIYRKISVWALVALVAATGFTSCSEDSLDTNQYKKSGVNILAFGPMPVTRGETMRLTGTQLDNVRQVLFPEGNQKLTPSTTYIAGEFSVKSAEEMIVTIPDQCVPGKLRLVTNSGDTIVSKSNITFGEEIKVSSFSPTSIHPGDVLIIKGEFVWNIGQVVFFDHVTVDAENFIKNTRNEIQLIVPAEAITGELAWNDGSEGAENTVIGNLSVDAPIATGLSNATPEFGEILTIYGENLDLVTAVEFPAVGSIDFQVAENGKAIKVLVPSNTISGNIVMTAASGLTTSATITLPLATVTSTDPTKDVKAGQTITIKGTNLDRITHLTLPGVDAIWTDFTKTTTKITFKVPEGMGDGKVVLTQHENRSVESAKIEMYSDAPETTLWSGTFVCSKWNGMQELAWGGFDWTTIKPNTQIIIYYKKNNPGVWGCISLRHGTDWGNLPAPIPGQYDLDEDEGKLVVTLTQAVLNDIIANNGLVVTGDNYTMTKIAIPSEEVVFWKSGGEGPISWSSTYRFALEGHDSNNECLAEFPQDVWDKIKYGTFYLVFKTNADWFQVRITNGWWDCQWQGNENDFTPNNMADEIIDNGDGTRTIKINFGSDPIVGTLDQKHLLLTGDGYTPLKLYYK